MMQIENIKKFDFVFVVVTFRNAEDLFDLNKSVKKYIDSYKIVVVNSYYNESTKLRIQSIAESLDCDFVNIENKGYGFGNNKGIEYVNNKYDYDFLIISNPDVIIKKFDFDNLFKKNLVIGPKIITLSGKFQNPYWAKRMYKMERMIYLGFLFNSRWRMIFGQGVNKIIRELFLIKNRKKVKPIRVYALHGAFIIFSKDVINKIFPLYDEKMFLYYEEAYLARRLEQYNINRYYYPNIEILHKEDCSTKDIDFDMNSYAKESFIYYFERK